MTMTMIVLRTKRAMLQGGSMKHIFQYHKIICFLLTVFLLVSGMGFGTLGADASSVCVPVNQSNSSFWSCQDMSRDMGLCTTEVLGSRNNAGVQLQDSRYISKKGDIRRTLDYLGADPFFLQERKFFAGYQVNRVLMRYLDDHVITYIHEIDGKKRI